MHALDAAVLAELVAGHEDHQGEHGLACKPCREAVLADVIDRHRAQVVWNDIQEQQLQAVQSDWEQALARVLANWRGIARKQRMDLLDQVLAALEADDIKALTSLVVSTKEATDELSRAMRDLADVAAQRMATEVNSQGVETPPLTGDLEQLDQAAGGVASLLGQGLALSAAREALRVAARIFTPSQTTRRVQDHLEALSDATLRDLAGGALSRAQNQARIETLRGLEGGPGPVPAFYANETLDRNTCGPCRAVDGRWLGNSLDQVEQVYPGGGYLDCLGRERCRGTVVVVFRPETVAEP